MRRLKYLKFGSLVHIRPPKRTKKVLEDRLALFDLRTKISIVLAIITKYVD